MEEYSCPNLASESRCPASDFTGFSYFPLAAYEIHRLDRLRISTSHTALTPRSCECVIQRPNNTIKRFMHQYRV